MARARKSVTHASALGLSASDRAHEGLSNGRAVLGAPKAPRQGLLLHPHLANRGLIKAVRRRLISLGNDFLDSDFVSRLISSSQLNGLIVSRPVEVLHSQLLYIVLQALKSQGNIV